MAVEVSGTGVTPSRAGGFCQSCGLGYEEDRGSTVGESLEGSEKSRISEGWFWILA